MKKDHLIFTKLVWTISEINQLSKVWARMLRVLSLCPAIARIYSWKSHPSVFSSSQKTNQKNNRNNKNVLRKLSMIIWIGCFALKIVLKVFIISNFLLVQTAGKLRSSPILENFQLWYKLNYSNFFQAFVFEIHINWKDFQSTWIQLLLRGGKKHLPLIKKTSR